MLKMWWWKKQSDCMKRYTMDGILVASYLTLLWKLLPIYKLLKKLLQLCKKFFGVWKIPALLRFRVQCVRAFMQAFLYLKFSAVWYPCDDWICNTRYMYMHEDYYYVACEWSNCSVGVRISAWTWDWGVTVTSRHDIKAFIYHTWNCHDFAKKGQ